MKKISLYALVSGISLIARQFFLPNPFECFDEKAALINLIAEPFIQILAYVIVGLVYKKGSFPPLGSFLFLVTYAMIIVVLRILSVFVFVWWWVILIVIAFSAIIIGIRWVIEKISGDEENY